MVSEPARESLRKALTPERQSAMQEAFQRMRDDPIRYQAWLDALAAARAKRMLVKKKDGQK